MGGGRWISTRHWQCWLRIVARLRVSCHPVSSPPVQQHRVLQASLQHQRTEVAREVMGRTVLFLTARRPHLIAGGTEEEAGRGDHVGCPMVLKVVRVEEKQVREVAPALQQAGERVRKALVRKEGRAATQHREAEVALFQLPDVSTCIAQLCDILSCAAQPRDVLICVAQISHLLQLQGYYVFFWLLRDNVLNFHILTNIHSFQGNLSLVPLSTGIFLCKEMWGITG